MVSECSTRCRGRERIPPFHLLLPPSPSATLHCSLKQWPPLPPPRPATQSWGLLPQHATLTVVTGPPLRLPEFKGGAGACLASSHSRGCTVRQLRDSIGGAQRCAPHGPEPYIPTSAGDLRSPEGRALVDDCHARYCAALRALWDEHKNKYAPNRMAEMEFVS